ncbi:MAG: tRNA pseudouridine(55) synthase TruB [Anaplasma sp.]
MRERYGWLNIDKPYGMSSGGVVDKIKKMLNCKVGHAGTLDPLATGVLPIAVGKATKVVYYAMDTLKSYEVTAQWGVQRSTDDAEGEVIGTSDLKPSAHEIEKVLGQFIGNIQQTPPASSAIKIAGARAYSLAREGRDVAPSSREVCVIDIKLVATNEEGNTADFLIVCRKGFYVRALIRDLGITLGCLGYVSALRRKEVGPFPEESAVTLDRLEALVDSDRLDEVMLPLCHVIVGIPKLEVDESLARAIKNGRSISMQRASLNGLYAVENCDMCYVSRAGGVPVAVCKVADGAVRPVRVFDI